MTPLPQEPQPGTIPHRAVTWLRAMEKVQPGGEHSTPELCEAIDVDTDGFTACMRPLRERGLVHTKKRAIASRSVLLWRLGDGTYDPGLVQREVLVYDANLDRSQQGKRSDQERSEPLPPEFRTTVFEGKLLATGMEIVDGVAVFTGDQVLALKRQTDWWPA